MLDSFLRPYADRPLNYVGCWCARRRVRADLVTWSGFALGGLAFLALALQAYWIALALILANRLADGLDGAVARSTEPTDIGAFLDIVLDFLFYAGAVLGFVLSDPAHNALAGSFLIFSFVASGTTFLAFAVIAARRGMETKHQGLKGIYYLGGLMEGTETIVFFVLVCLFPSAFPVLAWVFGALCLLTAVGRVLQAYRDFPTQ